MGLSNDERGWVMTSLSGIACVVGASVICVDILIRQFPRHRNFRIQDSDTFLSASLSLSFGVMLFSALYSMLPSAKSALTKGGLSPKMATWIMVACFLGGIVGIQIVSNILHRFIPSHVVDCEHTHDNESPKKDSELDEERGHLHDHAHETASPQKRPRNPSRSSLPGHISRPDAGRKSSSRRLISGATSTPPTRPEDVQINQPNAGTTQHPGSRRPSLQQRMTSTLNQLAGKKDAECTCEGPCYGFSDPCGQACFKNVNRGSVRGVSSRVPSAIGRPAFTKSATATTYEPTYEGTPLLRGIIEEERPGGEHMSAASLPHNTVLADYEHEPSEDNSSGTLQDGVDTDLHKIRSSTSSRTSPETHHHHHVPTNAFLSIGLQTSIAIALHKLPEGFITYATNHANPSLGFSVFLALFIHNITEGFAMALPLYLAINSRPKAMVISFVLGGLSQPIGAGVAAVWFKLAGVGKWAPSEGVYGGMFAVTAGIMASVALQLFSESLDLTHSRTLCMVGAFTGMGILGISSALTA